MGRGEHARRRGRISLGSALGGIVAYMCIYDREYLCMIYMSRIHMHVAQTSNKRRRVCSPDTHKLEVGKLLSCRIVSNRIWQIRSRRDAVTGSNQRAEWGSSHIGARRGEVNIGHRVITREVKIGLVATPARGVLDLQVIRSQGQCHQNLSVHQVPQNQCTRVADMMGAHHLCTIGQVPKVHVNLMKNQETLDKFHQS